MSSANVRPAPKSMADAARLRLVPADPMPLSLHGSLRFPEAVRILYGPWPAAPARHRPRLPYGHPDPAGHLWPLIRAAGTAVAGRTVGIIGPDRIGGGEWRRLDAFEVGFEAGDAVEAGNAFEAGGRIPTRIRCAWTCAHGTGTGTAPGPAGTTLLAQSQEATKGDGGW